jgi:hypothetical protein
MYAQFIWSHVQDVFEAATTLKLFIFILLNHIIKIKVVDFKRVFNMRLYKLRIRRNPLNNLVFQLRRMTILLFSHS